MIEGVHDVLVKARIRIVRHDFVEHILLIPVGVEALFRRASVIEVGFDLRAGVLRCLVSQLNVFNDPLMSE